MLKLKQHIVALVIALCAIACYAIGTTFDDRDAETLATTTAGTLAGLAGLVAWVRSKHDGRPPSSGAIAGALMLGVMAIGNGGCAKDPQMQVMQLREVFTVANDAANTAYKVELIDYDALATIYDVGTGVEASLDVAEALARGGDAEAFRQAVQAVKDGLRKFIDARIDAERRRRDGSTGPVGPQGGVGPAGDLHAGEPPADGGRAVGGEGEAE